jgi:murein L,D-transpeptidase YcbB/YkuD
LPPMRRDPRWLEANGYEIVLGQGDDATPQPASPQNIELLARGKLRVRQKPGPANALGLVKFMLPNAHNIYLHDTPARALFSRSRRDFSHGCIRVSDPMALIRYVLGDDPQWPTERIQAAMQSGGPTRIPLPRRIPVFVLYGTALVRSTGETLFFDDVYGHDARLQAAIASRPH